MTTRGSILAFKLQSCVILSVDSQFTTKAYARTIESRYDKLIQLYPKVFLGCLADREVCEALKAKFPIDPCEFTPKSLVEVANLVKDAVNFFMEDKPSTAEFLIIGAVNDDEKHKIYRISKEEKSWKHRVDEVMGNVARGGSGDTPLKNYLKKNKFNRTEMTEEEGIVYAFEAIKYAGQHDACTGGDIQVVAINADGFKRRKWAQDDLGCCMFPYRSVDPSLFLPNH